MSRTLICTAFVSLDGVVEAPGGEPGHRSSGWTVTGIPQDPDSYEMKGAEQDEAAAMMMGRVSYEAFSPVWPDMDFFAGYNAMPKFVVSRTLSADGLATNWGEITVLRGLDDKDKQMLRLTDSRAYSNGVQKQVFDVVR